MPHWENRARPEPAPAPALSIGPGWSVLVAPVPPAPRVTAQAALRAARHPELLSSEAQREIPLSLKGAGEAEAGLGGQQR